jgi:hypothetical protein
MSKGLLFWVLMILWLIFGFVAWWPSGGGGAWLYVPLGSHLLLFVLFVLLGWQAFGPPVS